MSKNSERASRPPKGWQHFTPVDVGALGLLPPVPDFTSPFKFNPNSAAPAPSVMATDADGLTFFNRPGVPRVRVFASQPQQNISNGALAQSHAAIAVAPVSEVANKALTLATQNSQNTFSGSWSASITYYAGNQVTYSGNYYLCLVDNINEEPDISPSYWQQIGSPGTDEYLGAWDSATAYVAGNQVSLASTGSYYICILANTNKSPDTNPTYWTLVGTSALFIGTWSSATAYVVGNQVVYNGNIYTCVVANTNQTPSTTSAYWTIVGSQSLSSIPPTGSLSKFTSPPLSYTSTTSSITITWPSGSISLPDGSTVSISSGSQTISSLASGVSYSFFPYWSTSANSLEWVQASDIASPQSFAGAEFPSGTPGYVSTTTSLTNPTTAKYSYEAWIYPLAEASATIIELNPNQTGAPNTATYGNGLYISYSAGTGMLYFTGNMFQQSGYNSAVNSPNSVAANTWHHVVYTHDGTKQYLYVDGALANSSADSNMTHAWTGTGYFRLNNGDAGSGSGFILSRAAYYAGTCLSATQVENHYNDMVYSGAATYDAGVSADSPTYWWKLTETSGTTATDSAGSNTGTYNSSFTLNQSETIAVAQGSPAYAWANPTSQVTMVQFEQSNYPMSAGAYGFTAATTSSGTGGGLVGGWSVPGIPYQLYAGA